MIFNKFTYLLLPVFVLLAMPISAKEVPFLRQDFEKTYSETFDVDGDGTVVLENRYGEIRVSTWDRDIVQIDVRVKVSADDQDDADDTFDRIQIDFSESGNRAKATTSIGDRRGKGGGILDRIFNGDWSWGGSSSNDFKVYYEVKMPASANLETTAKYCDVELPDLTGDTRLSIGYGDLYAGDLKGQTNAITVSYGSARIGTLGGDSELRLRYSEGSLNEAGNLRYDGRYSDYRIGSVGKLDLNIGYEDIEVGTADEIRMNGNYSDVEVDKVGRLFIDGNYNEWTVNEVRNELEVDASYGDLEIDRLVAGFSRVYIRTNYIDVELDIDSDAGYELELRTRYGDVSYDKSRIQNLNSDKSGSSKTVTGTVTGKGNGRVDISTSYGDIELD